MRRHFLHGAGVVFAAGLLHLGSLGAISPCGVSAETPSA